MKYSTYEREWIKNPTQKDIEKVFWEAYENGQQAASEGRCADYIPELAKADPSAFGIYALDDQGRSISFGDVDTRFSIQSISKVINLAVSLKFRGFRDTFSHVMMEPSGDAFNSNKFGNSVAAVTAMEHVSHRLGLHVFEYTW